MYNLTDDDDKLLVDYREFTDKVMTCYQLLLADRPKDKERVKALITYTAGLSMGIASRIGAELAQIALDEALKEYKLNKLKEGKVNDQSNTTRQ